MPVMEPPPAVIATGQCVLCVDDEPNVLTALRRVFRRHGYRIVTANSGAEALELLEHETVDVVISDMRMPVMDGAALLEQVCLRWPDVVRLLLTGHSDIDATIGAINRGKIYRYIAKPWDENDLLVIVQHALERKTLEKEKHRLELLTRAQNAELQQLNEGLERKVGERTAQLKDAFDSLAAANGKLKTGFLTSIKVFSNLIELREADYVGHSRRVADLGRQIAAKMGLGAREAHDIFVAGLLHDVGKIGLSEALLRDAGAGRDSDGAARYRKYPLRGEQALTPLEDLRGAAKIVRSHRERFDGRGFPDGLVGLAIPIGGRIVAVAKDFDGSQIGMFNRQRMSRELAVADIVKGRNSRYDPDVVDAFVAVMGGPDVPAPVGVRVVATDLGIGMALSRDLVTPDGVLLLAADHVLDEGLIACIRDYQASDARPLTIYVKVDATLSNDTGGRA